ncbi:MAG: sulfurtransferase TusA family protein [Alysiella sp.]|uniref:sulfurtransferase TusA family protein n=1 Tax=Alysiella sp. TaxID=1872483 RepID=UPI0026DB7807|nr:sulfurtransferase TusA family protein [Alysiella sp.]MDO4434127.1 sulfurtransferase TusA family protein [Alysiella sp.]
MTTEILDLTGLKCPLPILRTKKALASLPSGSIITVLATDSGAPNDFLAFCRHTGHELLESSETNGVFTLVLKRK